MTMLYDNLGVNDQGHLTVGGLDTVALAGGVWRPAVCVG